MWLQTLLFTIIYKYVRYTGGRDLFPSSNMAITNMPPNLCLILIPLYLLPTCTTYLAVTI